MTTPTAKTPRACISCFHGFNDRIAGALFCRRYPRQAFVNLIAGKDFGKVFSHYPAHEPTDICGEYTSVPQKPKETQQ